MVASTRPHLPIPSLPCANGSTPFSHEKSRNWGSIDNRQSPIENPPPGGSFFQRPGYQVVNLAMRVQFPYEPLDCDDPFV